MERIIRTPEGIDIHETDSSNAEEELRKQQERDFKLSRFLLGKSRSVVFGGQEIVNPDVPSGKSNVLEMRKKPQRQKGEKPEEGQESIAA